MNVVEERRRLVDVDFILMTLLRQDSVVIRSGMKFDIHYCLSTLVVYAGSVCLIENNFPLCDKLIPLRFFIQRFDTLALRYLHMLEVLPTIASLDPGQKVFYMVSGYAHAVVQMYGSERRSMGTPKRKGRRNACLVIRRLELEVLQTRHLRENHLEWLELH